LHSQQKSKKQPEDRKSLLFIITHWQNFVVVKPDHPWHSRKKHPSYGYWYTIYVEVSASYNQPNNKPPSAREQ
jgi:hypothetical protein